MVLVVIAGDRPTPVDSIDLPAPDPKRFGALATGFTQALIDRDRLILTDDYAPIDRLIGRPD